MKTSGWLQTVIEDVESEAYLEGMKTGFEPHYQNVSDKSEAYLEGMKTI